MFQRLTISKLAFAAFGLCLAAFAAPAFAQTAPQPAPAVPSQPTTTTATYGDWVLRCVAAPNAAGDATSENCEIVLTIQVQGQTQPIAQLAIGHLPNETDLILTAVLPVNITIPGKIHVSGNAKTGADEKGGFDLSWTRCLPGACFAEAKPTTEALDTMRAETAGQLRFTDGAGRNVALPLSWRGLTQALAALETSTETN